MMKLFALLLFFTGASAWSQTSTQKMTGNERETRLEWDMIERASSYDLEIYDLNKKLVSKKDATSELFSDELLVPGKYYFKIRSRDRRNVPGKWSVLSEFTVSLQVPKSVAPEYSEFVSKEAEPSVSVEWQAVPLAENYKMTLINQTTGETKQLDFTTNSATLKLKIGNVYSWSVVASSKDFEPSEPTYAKRIAVIGGVLPKVKAFKPAISSVPPRIAWEAAAAGSRYRYTLKLAGRTGSVTVTSGETDLNYIYLKSDWPAGKYSLEVTVLKEGFRDSEAAAESFAWNGFSKDKRKIASAEELKLSKMVMNRQSIERSQGYYLTASYLVSQINYSGKNADSNSLVQFGALGGIGRIGVGYERSENNQAFQATFETAGYILSNQVQNYFSLELSTIFKQRLRSKEMLKFKVGASYKEQLNVIDTTSGSSTPVFNFQKLSYLGPNAGIIYNYAFDDKFGFEAMAQMTTSLITLGSPNSKPISNSFELRAGLMGTYRFTNQLTGLLGYTYQADSIRYQADAGSAGSQANDGDTNQMSLSGHFLHFLTEWNF